MNARELLDEIERDLAAGNFAPSELEDAHILRRALRLLAAAEANDGSTPETDAFVSVQFGQMACSHGELTDYARRLERERNGLAARARELEPDAERWEALVAIWHEATELFLTQDEDGTWSIAINESVDNVAGHWDGDTPNAAIDAARGSKP